MRIKQKYTDKIIGGSYQYWKDKVLANHVEENYDILSHPDIVDVYQIDTKTGIKKYITTTDHYIAVTEYINKSDTYIIKKTSAKFDEYYRMIAKPDGMATKELTDAIITFINPNKVETLKKNEITKSSKKMKRTEKIFISHSSKDERLVRELINIIETIGVSSEDIFCSSFEGYGIRLGENFLERLKTELNNNILVIFVLSENFYNSPICLCEMGATWIKTTKHIPILIPPFNYEKIKGVIQNIQGLKINEQLKLNLLKENLEYEFNINPINNTRWESKRNEIVDRINLIINESNLDNEDSDSLFKNEFEKLDNAIKMIIYYTTKHNIRSVSFQKIKENINPKFDEQYVMDLVEKNPLLLSRTKLKSGQFGIKINTDY